MTAHRLPLPPTANQLVRPVILRKICCPRCHATFQSKEEAGHGPLIRLVSTREADDFREAAHEVLPVEPVAGPVELHMTVYVPTISSDGPNREKALADALNARLFYDDKQVAEWHGRKVVCVELEPPLLGEPDKRGKRKVLKPGVYAPPLGVELEVRPADPLQHAELSRRLATSKVAEQDAARRQGTLDLITNETAKQEAPRVSRAAGNRSPSQLPEPLQRRLQRLATSAVISHREPQ